MQGRHEQDRSTNEPHARLKRHAYAETTLAGAIVFAAWWLGIQRLLSVCVAGTPAEAWLWIAAIACTLLVATLVLIVVRQRAPRAIAGSGALTHARLDGIIRSTTEAIITIDSTQRIVLFNPMAERVFRCPASDAIGASLSRFIPERFRSAHEHQVRQFGTTGVSDRQMGAQRVLFGLRADGEEFPLEASISQTEDDDGKLFTVVLRDVTDRVKAAAQLEESREELRALSANLQQLGENEKSRIARELHDDLGQTLTALKMDVFSLETELAARKAHDADIADRLKRMLGLIDRNIASLRRIAAHQRPVMLDDLGLHAAIDWLVDDFVQRYGLDVTHTLNTGDIVFNTHAATAVFRIIEEALANVARHAHASRVELLLEAEERDCVLRVSDDGVGVRVLPAPNGKCFGLIDVRERANALGGRVCVDSMPDNGFVLTVVLPREAVHEKESQP